VCELDRLEVPNACDDPNLRHTSARGGVQFKAFNIDFLMIDLETAGMLRLLGLVALAISIAVWALAERSGHHRMLISLSAAAALLSALIYLLGVTAASDSGASRFLPHFP